MAPLIPRTMSVLRPRLATATYSLPSTITAARQQVASISYRPDPQAIKRNPNHANKIPPSARPLSRDPVPPPTITPEELSTRPYAIRRTAFAQLPIYRAWKSGGTNIVVMIKKINGNKQALAQELTEKLGIAKERIKLNPTTGHLELKVREAPKDLVSSGRSLTDITGGPLHQSKRLHFRTRILSDSQGGDRLRNMYNC